ncbi:MAG: beta-ketoacyl synthase N-terminal-like domain-containing protein [Candidatus Peribacteraceae bacterium]
MKDTIYVLGGAQTRFGELWEQSLTDLVQDVVDAAIRSTGILPTDIDTIVIGNMLGGEASGQGHLGAYAGSLLPHRPPALRVEAACASGGVAMHTATALLESGRAGTVLVIGAEKLTDLGADDVTQAIMHAGDAEKDGRVGLTFPGIFALTAAAYMHRYGLTREELSLVSEHTHKMAVGNPYAQFQKEIPAEMISKSTPVADPLRLLDCSPITDGAAAVLLSTQKESNVRLAASALATEHLSLADRASLTSFESTKAAMQRALREARWSREDIDYLELHDCFSIASIIHVEDMGFAEEGRGIDLFKKKEVDENGMYPINLSGGLKACGHPVGATGVKQILDCYKQLTNQAPRKVSNARRALAHNLGGVGATCTIHLLEATNH